MYHLRAVLTDLRVVGDFNRKPDEPIKVRTGWESANARQNCCKLQVFSKRYVNSYYYNVCYLFLPLIQTVMW